MRLVGERLSVTLSHAIGRQLEHPSGIGGWLTGRAMRLVNARLTALTINALAVQSGDIVLDMGCGTGDALEALARKVGSGVVYALDQSDTMLAVAHKRHTRRIRAGSIVLNYCDFAALPFADASFDRVLASTSSISGKTPMQFWSRSCACSNLWGACRFRPPTAPTWQNSRS